MDTKGSLGKINPKVFTDSRKRKMPEFPKDFIVVCDTREQLPFFKNKTPKGLTIVRDTLKNGDYSVRGFEGSIAIERKKMSDLMSYIGSERDRTVEKLLRLNKYEFKALVVEEDWDNLFLPKLYSQVHPESVRGFLKSINVRFGVHFFCHPNREECEWWILDRLLYFFEKKREGTKL